MIKYNENLGINEYIFATDKIAQVYFDGDNQYQPHIGLLETMWLFYSLCVTETKYDKDINVKLDEMEKARKEQNPDDKKQMFDLTIYQDLFSDDEFVKEFNNVVTSYKKPNYGLTFGSAFRSAMEIVKTKRNSVNSLEYTITKILTELADKFENLISPDKIEELTDIAKRIQSGETAAKAVVQAYGEEVGLLDFKQGD
jgi:hypothetical protein